MANTLAPFGLKFLGQRGVAANVELAQFDIANADTQAIYRGDPIKKLTTGYGAAFTAGTAVAQFLGVFVGCRVLLTATGEYVDLPYWPGSGVTGVGIGKYIPVLPGQRWLIQANANLPLTQVYTNFDFSMGSGSAVTGQSAAVLDVSTGNSTSTLPLRVVERFRSGAGNGIDHASAYNYVVVEPNLGVGTGLT